MAPIKTALAAVGVIAATLVLVTPAQALKALQYRAQGHGRYLNSNGTPKHDGRSYYGMHSRQHRHYRLHRGT